MEIERLLITSQVLGEVASALSDLLEERHNAVLNSLYLTIARTMVNDLAQYLHEGLEPYDALVAAASGKRELPESAQRTLAVAKLIYEKPAAATAGRLTDRDLHESLVVAMGDIECNPQTRDLMAKITEELALRVDEQAA